MKSDNIHYQIVKNPEKKIQQSDPVSAKFLKKL